MYNYFIILLLVLTTSLSSCRKMRYNEITIKGRVMDLGAWQPMPGEKVNLIEYSPGGFLLPDKATIIATSMSDANGNFGFPGVELRKNDKYYSKVRFVHHGTTTCCFCDYIDIYKNLQLINKDIVVMAGGGRGFV